jgi:hypothetical protein
VIGDAFEPGKLEKLREWSGGRITWQADGLAVISATY